MSTPVELVLSALDNVRRSGKNWMACCPAHDDRSPSLSITEGDDGRVLLHCYAGCDTRDVVSALGLQMADLFLDNLSQDQRQQYQRNKLEVERNFEQLVIEAAKGEAKAGELSAESEARLTLAQERVDQFDRQLAGLGSQLEVSSPVLTEVPLGDVMSAALEPVRFAIKPWMPRRHVALFGGHGGIGKSSLALAIGAHVAAGRPYAGHEVEQVPVLFVSLEDEPSIVRLRLRRIIEAYGLNPAEVLPNMRLLDGTHGHPVLMSESDGYPSEPIFSRAFRELVEQAAGTGLIIVDNASDAFDANENSRRLVRAFVRGLAAVARKHDAAVVLLAHIDKASAKSGSQGNSYSGSTAWHNSARSRLALIEQDGAIVLLHEKANLSTRADPLRLVFADGVLMLEAGSDGATLTSEHFDQAEIIRALRAAKEAGINVPASLTPGAHSAMKALEPFPEYGKTFKGSGGSKRAAQALAALRREGRVREETYRTTQRKDRGRLIIVEGAAQIGPGCADE